MILSVLFLVISNSISQEYCISSAYSPNKDLLLNTTHPDYSQYAFCVKIYVHVIRKSDGTGGQPASDVNEALNYLAIDFNPYQIYFDWDNSINYIDDTTIFYNRAWLTLPEHQDGVDIYLFDDYVVHPVTGLGYGQVTNIGETSKLMVTGYFVGYSQILYSLPKSHILSHEMGHVFNMWHTHHGTYPEAGDPDQCPEYVDGSNSDICGDYITDTPADPHMGFNIDLSNCEWLGSGFDGNDPPEAYDPDELNVMSYSHPYCMEYLTFEQSKRMKTALAVLPFLQLVSKYTNTEIDPCANSILSYYPNSSSDVLNLDLTNKPYNNIYTFNLYDSSGIIVLSGESQNILKTIVTSALDEGTYFLHFYENGEVTIKQIIVDQ